MRHRWPTLYIRVRPDRLLVKMVGRPLQYEDEPVLAVENETGRILEIGRRARAHAGQGISLRNGFDHPRVVVGDLEAAEVVLRHAVRYVINSLLRWPRRPWGFAVRPNMILHPLRSLEGGLTAFEERALEEMAFRAGARRVLIWTGVELSDPDIARKELGQWRKVAAKSRL